MVQRSKESVNDDLAAVLSMPEKRALSDDVASRLRAAILSGAFAPGERLREEQLARALGVSRGPVREALAELERQGLVVINRNRGAVVAAAFPRRSGRAVHPSPCHRGAGHPAGG